MQLDPRPLSSVRACKEAWARCIPYQEANSNQMRQHMKENFFWSQDMPQLVLFQLKHLHMLRNAYANTRRDIFYEV